ncbi:MAG: hypothetical protein E7211_20410 [Clostridium lundense]|nr:hypothetical protein [Clostridium lundense]
MKLQLRQIEMKGFKPYKDVKVVCFSENTVIEGDNGQGKSSIGDAITYAFLGTGANGLENAGSKLLNNESKDMYVILMFEVDGEEHILTRAKKGSKSDLILDTNSIGQVELMNWIKQKELFLSIFNPDYFAGLAPKDQKELLQKYLGEISFDEVIKEMGSEGQALIDDCFMVPQLYIERKREEIKDTENRENYLRGFIDGIGEVDIPVEKVFNGEEKLSSLKESLDKLNARPTQLHDISWQVTKQNELNSQLNALSNEKYYLEHNSNVLDEEKQIASKKLERERLLNLHSSLKSQLQLIKTVSCPKCGEVFEADRGAKDGIQKQINEVVSQGKTIASEVLDLQEILDKKKSEYEVELKNKLSQIDRKIADIQQEIQGIDISTLQAENDKHFNKLQAKRADIQKQIQERANEKHDIDNFNMHRQQLIEQNEKNKQAVEDAKAELSTFEPLRTKLNQDIERAKKFNSTKLKMQGEFIGQFLDKVNIQFQKIVKSTGEVKDDFKLQYEGKDFNLLSTSERIKAGLEISNLLMNATGYIYPVFVDNAESIVDIPQLETQMIAAKVKEGAVLR